MRFTVRSLAGKLIVSGALTLLLCMLLFSAVAWYFLKFYSEREARIDAVTHLTSIKRAYSLQSAKLLQELTAVASSADLAAVVSHSSSVSSNRQKDALISALAKYDLSALDLVSSNHKVLLSVVKVKNSNDAIPASSLLDAGLAGEKASSLEKLNFTDANTSSEDNSWGLAAAIPIKNSAGVTKGVLIAAHRIDDTFAFDLIQRTGFNVALCQGTQVLGTTIRELSLDQHLFDDGICTPSTLSITDGSEHYLTLSDKVSIRYEVAGSPSLSIVDIEPLYNFNTHTIRALEMLTFMGIFILTLGVTVYIVIARIFFIGPVRQLQMRVRTLVANSASMQSSPPTSDELGMLARSFNLLSESLQLQENESQVITKQMSDLLTMSDILISTLNLEHLLGEIVSRLGSIIGVRSVSLLLYGREMDTPWAVAQWSDSVPNLSLSPGNTLQRGAVTVHTDPGGDITMTATTKLAAMPSPLPRTVSSSAPRPAIRAPKLTQSAEPTASHRTRIPRPALRDLDMILARMAMQKQKIAYGEDVATIYSERGEMWAAMALEAGFRSVIAVPLLLQDSAIGAIMLYGDQPYHVSRRDTFLLSTAAIQAAMAIQNALLFAEVKEKNAALERVNHLKSQFLATVTHELRTPLHSIISYGGLILEGFVEGELTDEQIGHIQFMVDRAEDLSHLVDDMLDLSKIEADHLEVKAEPVALESFLTEMMNSLRPMANEKGLYLKLEMEDSLPMALADSYRMRQVVTNMVSNALKFTEKGGVTIRCMLLERYNMLRVSVHDTGIGISPAALDYIFEAFRQADGSTTRRFGGTGLGLTIAKKLIELQGGEVVVESIVGQGSTFSFTLPVVFEQTVKVRRVDQTRLISAKASRSAMF